MWDATCHHNFRRRKTGQWQIPQQLEPLSNSSLFRARSLSLSLNITLHLYHSMMSISLSRPFPARTDLENMHPTPVRTEILITLNPTPAPAWGEGTLQIFTPKGCFHEMGVRFVGVLVIEPLLFGVCINTPFEISRCSREIRRLTSSHIALWGKF